MLEQIHRLCKITVPLVTTEDTITIAAASLGIPVGEQVALAAASLIGYETSAGVAKSIAGGAASIVGANIVIDEPTTGFVTGDVLTVLAVLGLVNKAAGTASTVTT